MRPLRAVAAVTALALTPVAVAATASAAAPHRQPTRIGVAVADRTISPGTSDTVLGHLFAGRRGHTHALVGRHVVLLAKSAESTWTQVADATTRRHGYAFFTVTPEATTRYAVAFQRTRRLQGARSHGITVFVGTASTVAASAAAPAVDRGEPDTVTATLTAGGDALAGQTLVLRARPAGAHRAHRVATATTDSAGTATFTVTPGRTTRYRIVFRGGDGDNPAVSNLVRVTVRRPTSLSIRAKSAAVEPGESDAISGVLLTPHHPVRHRLVALMERTAGSSTWTQAAAQRTGRHGQVRFHVTPTATEDYMLSFAQTRRFDGCDSGVVTVTVA